jgi:hypothetical protein
VYVAGLHARDLRDRAQRRHVVRVGLHDAFRDTRRAGRVDDRRDVVGTNRRHPVGERALQRGRVSPTELADRVPREHARLPASHTLDDDDRIETGRLDRRGTDGSELCGVLDHDGASGRVVEDVCDLLGNVRGVDGNRHPPRRQNGEVGVHPLGAARREDRDRVARPPAKRQQPQRQLADDGADIAPGQPLPASIAFDQLRVDVGACLHAVPEERCECFGHAKTWS